MRDWVSPWWQAAVLPDRWQVGGVSVPALSVWHTFALEQVGNRFLLSLPADRDDAASLLMFARCDYRGGRRLILRPHHRARAMARIGRKVLRVPWPDMLAACRDYVDTCTRATSRWQRGDSKPCAVPYQWHIVHRLCADYGYTLDAAWNAPYALARALYDAGAEAAGDDSLLSVGAQEMEDNWPQLQAAAERAAS